MPKPYLTTWFWLVILATLLLAGCTAQPAAAPPPAAPSTAPETPTPLTTAAATLEPTTTPTLEPTATATLDPTATPTLPPAPTATPTAEPAPTEIAPTVVLTAALNLENRFFAANPPPLVIRRGPEDYYQTTGRVQPEDEVQIVGRNQTGSKVLLRLADGVEGWAWSHVLTAARDKIAQLPVVEAPAPTTEERLGMVTYSNFQGYPGLEETARWALQELVSGDKNGTLIVPLSLEELRAAPPISPSTRALMLANPALKDLPAELRDATSWDIFAWHFANQFDPPEQQRWNGRPLLEMIFEGVTRPDGTVVVPPLEPSVLAVTDRSRFQDVQVILRPDLPAAAWWNVSGYWPRYTAQIMLNPQVLQTARTGSRDDRLMLMAGVGKELFSNAISQQLQALHEASYNNGDIIKLEPGSFDASRMTENLSHYALVYRFLKENGFTNSYVTDYYLNEVSFQLTVGKWVP